MNDVSNFFVTFKTHVITEDGRKLDKNLILRFKAFTEDAQRELYRQYVASIDAMHFLRAVENREPILFKVETFKIDTKRKTATFKLPCHERVRIYLDGDLINGITAHDLMLSYIRGIPKLVKNGRYAYYVLEDVEIRTYRPKTDVARELLNEHEPLDLIAYALGYKPTPEVKALILPRVLPLFTTNEDSSGTHVLSLTSPGLGKSECARILSELAQAYFSPFFPATTKLIGDARTNTYGLAYHYNTIYVDEFLHGESAKNLKDNYNAILTGMENGKWSRERGQIDYERTVSFAFFGNVKNDTLNGSNISAYSENQREIIKGILTSTLGIETIDAFIERLAYVEYQTIKDYRIMQDLNRDENGNVLYLDPSLSRGIIKIIAENVLKSERLRKNPKDRYERHVNRLYAILKALGVDVDEDTVERLVYGDTTFWAIRHKLFKNVESPGVKSLSETVETNTNVQNTETPNITTKTNDENIENIDFSMESALGIERESFDDFLDNSEDNNEDLEDNEGVEYVTVKIIDYCSPKFRTFVGVDGKIYTIPPEGRTFKCPKDNAIPIVEAGVGVIVNGKTDEDIESLVNGYDITTDAEDLIDHVEDRKLTNEEIEEIRKLRLRGLTVREISRKLSLPIISVKKVVDELTDHLLGCNSVEEFLEAVVH